MCNMKLIAHIDGSTIGIGGPGGDLARQSASRSGSSGNTRTLPNTSRCLKPRGGRGTESDKLHVSNDSDVPARGTGNSMTTDTTKERAKDLRLQREHGITLVEYKAMLKAQDNRCAVCGRPQETFKQSLSVDHDHGFDQMNVGAFKRADGDWFAQAIIRPGFAVMGSGKTKSDAIASVRRQLKYHSVRGALCNFCNRGLRFYNDDPSRLFNAAEYLQQFQGRTPIQRTTTQEDDANEKNV
jgi:hypothetical protein